MNSHNSQLCHGISISTGKHCKNYVQSGYFCYHHKDQICGNNKYGVSIIQKSEQNSNIKLTQNNCCNGTTATDKPCKIRLKSIKFCHHHKNQDIDEKNSPKGEIIDKKSPSDNPNVKLCSITQECSGITKRGKKCKKIYKHGKFCHKHSASEESNNTLFIPGRAKQNYYSIDEWINIDISQETRILLKNEMEKPISESDESGFIYVYRLLEDNHAQYTLYKVGRTINVEKRLYQWDKQCKFRPKLIETFPKIKSSSFNKENIKSTREIIHCKYIHRAERLIHIELKSKFNADTEKCKNCGSIHQEWFKVTNLDSSNVIKGMHGWDEISKIIVHWISYIEKVYGQTI